MADDNNDNKRKRRSRDKRRNRDEGKAKDDANDDAKDDTIPLHKRPWKEYPPPDWERLARLGGDENGAQEWVCAEARPKDRRRRYPMPWWEEHNIPKFGNCPVCRKMGPYGATCETCQKEEPPRTIKFEIYEVGNGYLWNPRLVANLHRAGTQEGEPQVMDPQWHAYMKYPNMIYTPVPPPYKEEFPPDPQETIWHKRIETAKHMYEYDIRDVQEKKSRCARLPCD